MYVLKIMSELYNPYIDHWPQKNGGLCIITYNYISVFLYKISLRMCNPSNTSRSNTPKVELPKNSSLHRVVV